MIRDSVVVLLAIKGRNLFFMFPIRDTIQAKNHAIVNVIIIFTNVLVFIVEILQGDALQNFIFLYGLVPARYTVLSFQILFSTAQKCFALLSFMFIHGGLFHLIGNIWFLYIFGDNVEDRLGHSRYLLFYLMCGLASGLFHVLTNLHSQTPTIGASGAIAGVMGAYFLLYPRSKIITLIPILFIPFFIELPAYIFLGFWLFFQFISASLTHTAQVTGVAWWAHIGGFVSGMLLLKVFLFFPESPSSRAFRQRTAKKKTPRLQMAKPELSKEDLSTYSTLTVSPLEALNGAAKLVTLRGRYVSRIFRVSIPPGIRDGDVIRLRGISPTKDKNERKEDVYLRIRISNVQES